MIIAFMLLRRAKVDDRVSRNLILSKLDHNEDDMLYEQMESQILEVQWAFGAQSLISTRMTKCYP